MKNKSKSYKLMRLKPGFALLETVPLINLRDPIP